MLPEPKAFACPLDAVAEVVAATTRLRHKNGELSAVLVAKLYGDTGWFTSLFRRQFGNVLEPQPQIFSSS